MRPSVQAVVADSRRDTTKRGNVRRVRPLPVTFTSLNDYPTSQANTTHKTAKHNAQVQHGG